MDRNAISLRRAKSRSCRRRERRRTAARDRHGLRRAGHADSVRARSSLRACVPHLTEGSLRARDIIFDPTSRGVDRKRSTRATARLHRATRELKRRFPPRNLGWRSNLSFAPRQRRVLEAMHSVFFPRDPRGMDMGIVTRGARGVDDPRAIYATASNTGARARPADRASARGASGTRGRGRSIKGSRVARRTGERAESRTASARLDRLSPRHREARQHSPALKVIEGPSMTA